jgi:hypothetical protein
MAKAKRQVGEQRQGRARTSQTNLGAASTVAMFIRC